MHHRPSLRSILGDDECNPALAINDDPAGSPLVRWLRDVADTPINQLSDPDLARACRQELALPEVVAELADRFLNEQFGQPSRMHDDELVRAVSHVPRTFWASFPVLRNRMIKNLETLLEKSMEDVDSSDIRQAIAQII